MANGASTLLHIPPDPHRLLCFASPPPLLLLNLASVTFTRGWYTPSGILSDEITSNVIRRGDSNAAPEKASSDTQVVAVVLQLQIARLQDPQEHGSFLTWLVHRRKRIQQWLCRPLLRTTT